MPKNLRFVRILLALCLASLVLLIRPVIGIGGKFGATGTTGQAARAGDCGIRQDSFVRSTAGWLQLAGKAPAQQSAGAGGQASQAGAFSPFAPGVTTTDHKMTAGPIPDNCVAPLAKYNFTPTDTQAYQWVLVSGANVGDVVRWEFVQPGGTIYFQTQTQPLTFSGSVCFSASIFIAGRTPASLPGAWQTRVFYNGSLLLTENFNIGPAGGAVTITDHKMSGGPIPDNCVAPAAKSTFATTDALAYQWIFLSGIRTGDVIRWEFVQPNGTPYQATEFTVNFSGPTGCFWASIAIAGQTPATLPGNWQVRVLFNTAQILTENFTIAASTCPSVTGINPTSGLIGSIVMINGANFTGVNAVKFAGGMASQYNVISAAHITATVPTGAATGPITIGKPNCADVQTPSFTIASQPLVGVTPPNLDFGGVSVGQVKDLPLTVNNTGNATLTVSSITSNNPRFSVTAPVVPFNVAAGAQASVTVRFVPSARGPQTGTLSLNSNDPTHARVDVPLAGNGLAPVIEVSPTSLGFGNVAVGRNRDLQITVRNTGDVSLSVTSIASSDPQFSVVSPTGTFNVAAGGSAVLTVRFAPASAGAKTGTLSINNNDPSRARVDVPLTGTGLAPLIEVTPPSLNFGNVVTGESAVLKLIVRNIGNAPLNIASIASNDPQFSISLPATMFALPGGSSINVSVRFAPASAGAKTGALSVNSNDPIRPRVDVPMTGTGLAPVIDVSPPTLGFGDVKLAQAKDLVLTIRNTGTATLKVSSVTSSNPQFSVTQFTERPSGALRNLPLAITPNTSVELTVRLRPSFVAASVGAISGALSINSNDPNRPRVDVPVTGTGIGALIGAPSSLSFGGVTVCLAAASTTSLTLTNTGNAPLTIASLSIDNPAFALTPRPTLPLVVAPGASSTLPLSFYTRAVGTQTGRLIISSNAVNNPGLAVSLSGVGTPVPPPAISQITVSRTTLSHGRADTTRPVSPFNPFGLVSVIGFVFPGGALPANSISPGAVPPPLIGGFPGLPPAAITSAPDPLHITLAGGVTNPIVLSAANLPSCFTLAVAEGVTAPNLTRWDRIGSRFGSGNLYAAVSIPGTSIFAGMELVTEADLDAYTANSIIYEAPAFGLLVAPAGQNGGAAALQARARRIPADTQCQAQFSTPQSTQVEYSRTVRIEILSNGFTIAREGGDLGVTATAQIFGNFDPAVSTVVRWAYDGQTFTQVVDDPDLTPPGAPRVLTHTFHVPQTEECNLARIVVVASSIGNDPFAPPPLNPFLELAPSTIGLFTFRSGGSTVEDAKTTLITLPDSNCDGGGPVGWIQGVVTDAATGAPIAGAIVSVAGTSIFAITGDDGTYELNNVPAGQRNLDASADGFNSAQVQVNVVNGQVVARDIALMPFVGTIRGVILNAFDSQPIAGATIVVKGTNVAAVSGSDGSYTLGNVPSGPQTVEVSAANFISAQDIVTVVTGQTNVRDYFLTPKAGTIKGIVKNATTNLPIAGATVLVPGEGTATTGGDGSYTLSNISAGPQTVSAIANGFNPASVAVTVMPGQTVTQDIALVPQLGTVTGIVKDDYVQPIAGATVTAAGVTATTGADGSYTLANLPVGTQTVSASATGYRAASVSVTVMADQTTQQDIELPRVTGTVKGKITNATTGQPINGADVDLLPFPLSFASSDAGGNYTMTGVPTGPQVILATAPGYYAKLAVVNVGADTTVTQDFALTPQVGTVTGIVFDSFSQPVIGATLAVAGTSITATSNGEGVYTLSDVPVGAQTINVSVPGLRPASVTVNVTAAETVYKDIYLETPTGAVRGTVRNAATNQPIVGASILVGIPFGAVYYSAFTDGNGNYSLADIPAQKLTLYVGADGFMPAQADVTIVANQTATKDFALTPDTGATTGTITGVVKNSANNQPVSGVTVTVAGTNLSTSSGGDGSYTLSNVPAGAQTLNASKSGFRTATVPVTVTAGQSLTQDISLAPGAGTVTGTVRNAANGQALSGATITVAGTNLSATSGADGGYTIPNVPAGAQTLNASANGFIATQVQVTVTDGQTVTQNISLSPTLQQGEIRITLNWSKDSDGHPRDLDMHLTGPNPDGTCFEVYYGNLGNLDAAPFAKLEVDNIRIDGAPPTETIRISKLTPGTYRFYVYNYSGEAPNGLSQSRATVQVFGSGGQTGNFTVPSGSGLYWTVFEINGQTGAITTVNQLATPASNCK
jgi:hypothetical protein